jgi:hypothetical protein
LGRNAKIQPFYWLATDHNTRTRQKKTNRNEKAELQRNQEEGTNKEQVNEVDENKSLVGAV